MERHAVKTDKNGLFRIRDHKTKRMSFWPSTTASPHDTGVKLHGYGQPPAAEPFQRTVFFTDRSLYRPGQTVSFKGICVSVDRQRDKYQTVDRKDITVVFEDANGQEMAKQVCRTNDFGSFSGSFTAPRDRLTGRYTTARRGGWQRHTSVNVEEYKRPKFRVELATPAEAARLGGEVRVGNRQGLHGRGHWRSAGAVSRRPRSALSDLVVLALLVESSPSRVPGDRARYRLDRKRRQVRDFFHRASRPLDRGKRRTDRSSFTVYADVTDTTWRDTLRPAEHARGVYRDAGLYVG